MFNKYAHNRRIETHLKNTKKLLKTNREKKIYFSPVHFNIFFFSKSNNIEFTKEKYQLEEKGKNMNYEPKGYLSNTTAVFFGSDSIPRSPALE